MNKQAQTAIRAAKNRKQWGRWATMRFIVNNKIPLGLYRLALQLQAMDKPEPEIPHIDYMVLRAA